MLIGFIMLVLLVLILIIFNSYQQDKKIEELELRVNKLRKEVNNAIEVLINMTKRIKGEIKEEKND